MSMTLEELYSVALRWREYDTPDGAIPVPYGCAAAIYAALNTAPVRVKALEWQDCGLNTWHAETPCGEYVIRLREDDCLWWPSWGEGADPQEELSIHAAKQACQEHFASLINQCVESE